MLTFPARTTSSHGTAAHCGPGDAQKGDEFINNKRIIGNVSVTDRVNGGNYDAALIPGLGIGYVWGGSLKGDFARSVISVAQVDPIGGLICTDGALSGEVCAVKIKSTDNCAQAEGNHVTCHLVEGFREAINVAQPGDSGGPVETTIGQTGTEARGEIIGGTDAGQTVFYSPIADVAARFGYRVMLGKKSAAIANEKRKLINTTPSAPR